MGFALDAKPTHHALGALKGRQLGLSASLAFCALSLDTQRLPH